MCFTKETLRAVKYYILWSIFHKKKDRNCNLSLRLRRLDIVVYGYCLLYLVNDSLECFRVVYCEVSEHLAVNLYASLVEQSHKL